MSRRPILDQRLPCTMTAGYDSCTREYRVSFRQTEVIVAMTSLGLPIPPGFPRERCEAMAYYTTDRADMIGTAILMDREATPRSLVGESMWRSSKAATVSEGAL